MYIPTYVLYALVLIGILIFFRQFFVAWRFDNQHNVSFRLFKRTKKPTLETFDEKIDLRKRMIVDRAHQLGKVTNDVVEAMFHVSHTTAWRYLEDLEKEGKLKQAGTVGRGVIYEPVPGAF